ncbi:DUF2285 domain-containing protein [Roseibium sp. M-1]
MTVLQTGQDEYQVLLEQAGRSLQLVVNATDMSVPLSLQTNALWPRHLAVGRLTSLEALNALLQTGKFPPRLFPPHPRAKRLAVILQALDGALAGATHRDIALALFGAERVDRDWSDPGEHLRDQVRRAIRRGRYLMTKGYLDLLR